MKMTFVFLCLLLSGCIVTGPKTEEKHALNALNGENYDTNPSERGDTVGIPFVKRKERVSRLDGRLEMKSDFGSIPLKFVPLGLYDQDDRLVSRATSDANGDFHFSAVLANGAYVLKSLSPKYAASQSIEIKDYTTTGILLMVSESHNKQ